MRNKASIFWVYFILALITFAVFYQVRYCDFVNYDDDKYVTENRHVLTGLNLENITWAFTTGHASNWHPLTWLSHMLDCQLFKTDPGWHHIANLFFHIVNTLLLFTVLLRMTGATWRSAFVAALFALHPLHVESVAWVSERKDVLSTMFWFLTILSYLWYAKQPGIFRYFLTLTLFVFGLMAKPMLVTLPFVLLLLDYWPLERLGKQTLRHLIFEKIPLFVFAAASCVITFIVQQSSGALESTEAISLKFRIANAVLAYAKYILKNIWPAKLAFFYPHPGPDIQAWQVIISLLLILTLSVYIISRFRTCKYLLVGWFWFLGTLIPVIGFVQVGAQAMADRYTYISLIGLFIIAAWGITDISKNWNHHQLIMITSAIAVLLTLSVCARLQINHWQNSITLFEHALKVTEKNYTAHSCLAYVLCEQGKIDQAIEHNRLAIEFNPTYLDAQFNLGGIYLRQGNYTEALKQFYNVLQINPDYIKARVNIAKILVKQNKPTQAIPHYASILKAQPLDYDAQNGIGIALARIGRLDEAVDHFNRAIQIDPNGADAQNNLGFTLVRQGKFDQAALHLTEAIRLDPNNAKAHYQFAHVLSEKGDLNKAVTHLKKAIRLDPNDTEPMNNLAWFLVSYKGTEFYNPDEAVRVASRACELTKHKDPALLDTLTMALAAAGKSDSAIETAQEALSLAQSEGNTQLAAKIEERISSLKKTSHERNE